MDLIGRILGCIYDGSCHGQLIQRCSGLNWVPAFPFLAVPTADAAMRVREVETWGALHRWYVFLVATEVMAT